MPYALCITGRGIIGWVDIPPKGGRFSMGCFFDSDNEVTRQVGLAKKSVNSMVSGLG